MSTVFQSQRYTRMYHLRGEFYQSDALIVMDIARLDDGSEQPNRR